MEGKIKKLALKLKKIKQRLKDKEETLNKELRLCSAYRSFYLNEIRKKNAPNDLVDKLICLKCLEEYDKRWIIDDPELHDEESYPEPEEIYKNQVCLHYDTKEVIRFCSSHDSDHITVEHYGDYGRFSEEDVFCSKDCPSFKKFVKRKKKKGGDYKILKRY